MKLQVIGHKGVVGGATKEVLEKLGHEVIGVDKGDEIQFADVSFLCVPEDMVEEVANEWWARTHGCFWGVFDVPSLIIRSTVPPNTCASISSCIGSPSVVDVERVAHISYMPEHLREATARDDEWNPGYLVLGACCETHAKLWKQIYEGLRVPMHVTDPTTSELYKLAVNGFLSTIITYWNAIGFLADDLNVNKHDVAKLASLDSRIPSYGTRVGEGLTGRCLPKDLRQLRDASPVVDDSWSWMFFEAVIDVDIEVRRRRDGGRVLPHG